MLEHLLSTPEPLKEAASSFVAQENASPEAVIRAKVSTQNWLDSLDGEAPADAHTPLDDALATRAFVVAAAGSNEISREEQKRIAVALKSPVAVRKTAAMLTEYDWAFVDQAKQLRGYIVAKLLDETKNTKPEVRLKALKMLGDVTEVALFTHRTETVTKNLSDEQIEEEINKRLEKLTFNPATPLVERVDNDVDD